MKSGTISYNVRFPDGIRPALKELARGNQRSMNAEIIHRLSMTVAMQTDASQLATINRHSDAAIIRLPSDLHDSIRVSAKTYGRSMQMEISMRLIASMSGAAGEQPHQPNLTSSFAVRSRPAVVRVSQEHHERMSRLAGIGPYRVSVDEIVRRGIDLACAELEQMAASLPTSDTIDT